MLFSFSWATTNDLYSFATEKDHQRFEKLTQTLRCLVCQNQSLSDSDAPLAKDLRDKIYLLIQEKQSDQAIKQFLVSRYGEFILFSPSFNPRTWLLWSFPGLLLLSIFGTIYLLHLKMRKSHVQ